MTSNKAYVAQIQLMADQGNAWIKEHPEANVSIQWNFTKGTLIVAPIGDAIAKHFVTVNDDGAALIAAMWEGIPEELEPTVFMVQIAMEAIHTQS